MVSNLSCSKLNTSTRLDMQGRNENVIFTLDGEPFFPIIASLPIPHDGIDISAQLAALQKQGFNMLYTQIDYPDIDSRVNDIDTFLVYANQAGFPVIIELQEWDYWHFWLRENEDKNMLMHNGDRVMTYPDFSEPEALEEHLRRFREIVKFLEPYADAPIVAISIGAYDYYHIPDGEKHNDFSVPPHSTFPQTWLPYGSHVGQAYISFLKEEGFTPEDVGAQDWESILPPSDGSNMGTQLHWLTWNWYRQEDYVLPWMQATVETVRNGSGLPVTVTLDVRPSIWGAWGTDGIRWGDIFDFVIVYYYGMTNEADIHKRLKLLSHTYQSKGVPMISLLEFSSTLGVFMPADLYLNGSFPLVSGVQFGFAGTAFQHEKRLSSFLEHSLSYSVSRQWNSNKSDVNAAILLSSPDPFVYSSYGSAADVFLEVGIDYEVVYDIDNLGDYLIIYVPSNQPLLERQDGYYQTLSSLAQNGAEIIEGSLMDLKNTLDILPAGKK